MSDARNGRPPSARSSVTLQPQPVTAAPRRPQSQSQSQQPPQQQPPLLQQQTAPKSVWATPDIVPLTPPTVGNNRQANVPSREPRQVTLRRGQAAGGGLGFNIVGGELPGEPIFVSATVPGGPADRPGGLLRGDQLVSVNGTELAGASHEQAVLALKSSGDPARLLVAYRPDEYQRYEARAAAAAAQLEDSSPTSPQPHRTLPQGRTAAGAAVSGSLMRTTQKRSLHVRALFDYDPAKDAGLPSRGLAFRRGDILHVLNASDSEWWQARRLGDAIGDQASVGIIPSKKRVERRERSKLRRVNFNSRLGSQSGGGPPPSPTPPGAGGDSPSPADRKKSSSMLRKLHGGKGGASESAPSEEASLAGAGSADPVPTYEAVEQAKLNLAKPVILFGPLKDYLADALTSGSPDRFGHCVIHTTRQPRGNEQDGRDYHFVASRERMEQDIAAQLFIEAGQYNGNLYGTSLSSVRQVAESGRHSILDVSGGAIPRLEAAGLHPIAVFVRPQSVDNILELKPGIAEDQAKKMYERAVKLEAEFGHLFTATVSGHTAEDILSQVKKVISYQADQLVWVPSKSENL